MGKVWNLVHVNRVYKNKKFSHSLNLLFKKELKGKYNPCTLKNMEFLEYMVDDTWPFIFKTPNNNESRS